jgi:hypothetical protein
MNRRDDQAWVDIVSRLDLGDTSSSQELARAERMLAEAPPEEVTPAWVEEIVGQVTGSRMRVLPRVRRKWRASVAVATVMLAVALGAAGTVFVMKSSKGMGYEDVIELLEHPGKPEHHRRSALLVTYGHVRDSIDTLQAIRVREPVQELVSEAQQHLKALKELLENGKSSLPMIVDDDLEAAVQGANDAKLSIAERRKNLAHLAGLAASGIQAIRTMPNVTEQLSADLKNYLARLQLKLNQ